MKAAKAVTAALKRSGVISKSGQSALKPSSFQKGAVAVEMLWLVKYGNDTTPEAIRDDGTVVNTSWYYLDDITSPDWVSSESFIGTISAYGEQKEVTHRRESAAIAPVSAPVIPARRSSRRKTAPRHHADMVDSEVAVRLDEVQYIEKSIIHSKLPDAGVKDLLLMLQRMEWDPASFNKLGNNL